jgi:hypothetical protein
MAVDNISPFQLYTPKTWKGLTDTNHLAQLYQIEPYKMDKIIRNVWYVNDTYSEAMKFIMQFPEKEVPTERPLQWMLQGKRRIPVVLSVASTTLGGSQIASTDKCGLNRSRWYMAFPEYHFDPDHVIVGMKPNLYKVKVVAYHGNRGGLHWYETELVGKTNFDFIPYDQLAVNTQWSIEYTQTEQKLSERGTGTYHTGPFTMELELSSMRKEYEVPGHMIAEGKNNPLAFDFQYQDPKSGKMLTTPIWINKLDYDFRSDFYQEICNLLVYGTANKMPDGSYYNTGVTGNVARSGPGLLEQIAPSNVMKSSQFNIEELLDFLRSLSYGKLPKDKRKFTILTGEWGLADFSREIERIPNAKWTDASFMANGLLSYSRGTDILKGGIQDLTMTRPQYVKYADIQGIEIVVMHMPMYDDFYRNKELYAGGSGIVESRRMTILDFGTNNGESNIYRLKPKGDPSEIWGYIAGLRDPYSVSGSALSPKVMSTSKDAYAVHARWEGGVQIVDPTRCGEYVIDNI